MVFISRLFWSLLLLKLHLSFEEVLLFTRLICFVLVVAISVVLLVVSLPLFLFSKVAELTRIDILFLEVVLGWHVIMLIDLRIRALWTLVLVLLLRQLLILLLLLEMVALLQVRVWHLFQILVAKLVLLNLPTFLVKFRSLAHDNSHLNDVWQVRLASCLFNLQWHLLRLDLRLLGHSAEFKKLGDCDQVRYGTTECFESNLVLIVLKVMLD